MACAAQQIAPDPMSPGTYLRKRREAAGLGLRQAAANLATLGLSFARGRATRADHQTEARVALRLNMAEDDELPFSTSTAAPRRALNDAIALVDLPVPRVCRGCACSENDACVDDHGACAWSLRHPDLCTACDRKREAAKDLRVAEPLLTVVA